MKETKAEAPRVGASFRKVPSVHRPHSNCALLAGVGGRQRRNWSTILRRRATNMIYTAEPPVQWTAGR